MKKFQEERIKLSSKKRVNILRSLFFLVFVLLGIQIILSNAISSSGDKLQLLEQKHQQLLSQNELLSKQISYLTSLNTLENRARFLGYVNNTSSIYLQNTVNVAMKEVR